jgi:hypothetical protein
MTVTLEIPGELASRLGADAGRLSREALGLEAYRQDLWGDAELGQFLGISRLEVDQFLSDHGVELAYAWEDLEREREIHRHLAGS